jgi:hypothetical protein
MEVKVDAGEVMEYDVSSQASGLYIMKVQAPKISSLSKLIIQH